MPSKEISYHSYIWFPTWSWPEQMGEIWFLTLYRFWRYHQLQHMTRCRRYCTWVAPAVHTAFTKSGRKKRGTKIINICRLKECHQTMPRKVSNISKVCSIALHYRALGKVYINNIQYNWHWTMLVYTSVLNLFKSHMKMVVRSRCNDTYSPI